MNEEEATMSRGLRSTGRHTVPYLTDADARRRQDRHRDKYRADVRVPVEEGPDLIPWFEGYARASGQSRNAAYVEALVEFARARGYGQAHRPATEDETATTTLLAARTMPGADDDTQEIR